MSDPQQTPFLGGSAPSASVPGTVQTQTDPTFGGDAATSQVWSNHYQQLANQGAANNMGLANAAQALYGGQATAAQNQGAALANYGSAGKTTIDLRTGQRTTTGATGAVADAQNNARLMGQQGANLGSLQAAAAGQGPSAAAEQTTAGISQAVQAQLAAAASARGGAGAQALAQANAQQQAAQIQANAVGQGAATAAQAQQNAMGLYASTMNAMGTQGLQQQAQDASQAQFQAAQQSGQNALNAQTGLGYNQLGAQTGLAYNTLGDQTQQAYEGMNYNLINANLNAELQQHGINAGISENNASATQNAVSGSIGAGIGLAALAAMSDVNAKTAIEPQGDTALAGAASGASASAASAGAPGAPSVAGPGGALPAPMTADQGAQAAQAAQAAQGMTKSQAMQFLQMGQGLLARRAPVAPIPAAAPIQTAPVVPITSDRNAKTLYSDETAKGGAKGVGHVADEFLRSLSDSKATYSYKDPSLAPASRPAGARFGGVMAQSLERVPEIGRQLVSDTPRGKVLEGGATLSAALMGLGRLTERVNQLEGKGARA